MGPFGLDEMLVDDVGVSVPCSLRTAVHLLLISLGDPLRL